MESTQFSVKLIFFLSGFSGFAAYGAILGVLMACGLGVPIPEDITLLAAGVLVSIGKISLTGAMIVGFFGVLLGDAFLFFLGRKLGRRVFELPGLRKVFTPRRIESAELKIQSNSRFICFTARFLPGLRAPIFLTSGVLKVHPLVFLSLDGIAALISVPIWIVIGWWFGNNLDEALEIVKQIQIYILIAVAISIISYFLIKKRKTTGLNDPKCNLTEKEKNHS